VLPHAGCLRFEAVRRTEELEELMTGTKRAGAVRATRITVETETLVLVRRAKALFAWCPDCRAEVDVIALDKLTEPVAAQIHEWFGANDLHFWQMAEGSVRICVKSLLQSLAPEPNRCKKSIDQI
jgi:hypothetical protein